MKNQEQKKTTVPQKKKTAQNGTSVSEKNRENGKGTKKSSTAGKTSSKTGTGSASAKSLKNTSDAKKKSSRIESKTSRPAAEDKKRPLSAREPDLPDIRRKQGTPQLLEILLWVILAFCIILFLSNFSVIRGSLANAVSDAVFGLFGWMAYLFPILLIATYFFAVANRNNIQQRKRLIAFWVLQISICGYFALFSDSVGSNAQLAEFFRSGMEDHSGGGFFGGMICFFFRPLFGRIGIWICNLTLSMIMLLLLTGKSFVDWLQKNGIVAYETAKENGKRHQQIRRQKKTYHRQVNKAKKQERIAAEGFTGAGADADTPETPYVPRRNHIVSGVSMDTKIISAPTENGELHEITSRPSGSRKNPKADWKASQDKEKEEAVFDAGNLTKTTEIVRNESESGTQRAASLTIHRSAEYEKKENRIPDSTLPGGGISEIPETEHRPFSTAELPGPESEDPFYVPEAPVLFTQHVKAQEQDSEDFADTQTSRENHEEAAEHAPKKQPKSSEKEQENAIRDVEQQIQMAEETIAPKYVFPPINLLNPPKGGNGGDSDEEVRETASKLEETLRNFGVNVSVTSVSCGPAVTRYELLPEMGVKVSRIVSLSDDIKLNLAAADIRIEAPIPGKSAVGIEVPNKENTAVAFRELIETAEFEKASSPISFAVGKDIGGKAVVANIAKMPHLLIAGATGSGKSVCINTIIMSILYKADPSEVKLIMIDPKVVELSVYNGIPHLYIPVVTDPKKAAGALNWAVQEMMDRYQKFADTGSRDLKGYNSRIETMSIPEGEERPKKLPQIVIIVDELADLMMVAPGEVEDAICRLAQLARAAGIHLIIATQRPSVNVITGLIKANMPSRIAFAVTSGVDSRTILDMVGAEKLLGKGDMLFYPQGYQKPARVQGAFVSDEEVGRVVDFLKENNAQLLSGADLKEQMDRVQASMNSQGSTGTSDELDSYFRAAGEFVIEKERASIGNLQRVFKIGFNRAARIMDQLSDAGVVGPEEGTKPRKVLMTKEEFRDYLDKNL